MNHTRRIRYLGYRELEYNFGMDLSQLFKYNRLFLIYTKHKQICNYY